MEVKQTSYSTLILWLILLSVPISHSSSPATDSLECCDLTVGQACFCDIETNTDDYWGYHKPPDLDYLYYGDCKCNEISQLSVVLLTENYAKSITFFDTNDEENEHCSFQHIYEGQEIVCDARGDGIFADSTSFRIKRSDGSICEGRIDTTCAGDVIINEIDHECEELVVSGYVGDEGGICDDGLAPCECIGRYKRIIKGSNRGSDSRSDSNTGSNGGSNSGRNRRRGDSGSDSDSNDSDQDSDSDSNGSGRNSDSGNSDKHNKSDESDESDEGDGMIVSPLIAGFLDDEDTDSSGRSSDESDSTTHSHDHQSDDGRSVRDDGSNDDDEVEPLRIIEPPITGKDDHFIDDDQLWIDSDSSTDGLFIKNESTEDDKRLRRSRRQRANAPPLVNIIEPDISNTSIYVTMSYYIILLIVFINTVTFSFYFCIVPLNKYCKDNQYFKDKEFNMMDYNGYFKKSSKDIIIQSSIDSIDSIDADNDTSDDMSSLSDATEEEEQQ